MSIDRDRINKLADSIRAALEMSKPPYEPEDAVLKLNGIIIHDLNDDDVDAYIEKTGSQRFSVHLSKNQSLQRKRFSLAHELGHLFLHMGFIIDDNKWKSFDTETGAMFCRDNTSSKDEYEAHEFAAAFLMPKQEFLLTAKSTLDGDYYNVEYLANEFGVSLDAATNRGKWLGIFEW